MATASRASLEQEIYLRSLTGYLVGQNLLEGYKRVAVITYPDRICSAMAAALATSYIAKGNYRDEAAAVFTYEDGKEAEVAKKVVDYKPDIVYLSFGGEQKLSYVAEITKKILSALSQAGYKGALGIHVRVWLATKQLSAVLADKKLADYLASLKEVRLFTADVPNRKFLFHKVKIEGGAAKPEKYKEVEITAEHAKLLSISLPPPE
ncbi:hypothetical protein [Pyrobaculum neutrophilum]|uniref:Uncharacterized protein n=1 Tax=Pyrobaculum neutrophilum (strain DSM 2338 / JCM 9278 / NBRC 100436 / V24Sta) TaxID=444157 RepID=B1Y9D2_PYRNV|nr:hypothetical protein [Pyrobaculum neutrophilum]ACB40361.1 conserved hypothetical protein [Pyrobaculum neutrophilum V24Sta]